jgi:hypothetical protein
MVNNHASCWKFSPSFLKEIIFFEKVASGVQNKNGKYPEVPSTRRGNIRARRK